MEIASEKVVNAIDLIRDVWQGAGAVHALFARACRAGRMKLSHAAVSALVGWYLMMPPLIKLIPPLNVPQCEHGPCIDLIDEQAPLSKWEIFGSFDTVERCEGQLMFSHHRTSEDLSKAKPAATKAFKALKSWKGIAGCSTCMSYLSKALSEQQMAHSVCIATDDARLKGN